MQKKILHIQVLPKLSGVQKISLEIFKSLSLNEYQKYIIFSGDTTIDDNNECIKAFEQTGAHVLVMDNLRRRICFKDIFAFIQIYRLCKKERFDIVHTNSTKPGIVGRIAATLAGVPLVIHTVHGLAFYNGLRKDKWIFYYLCEMFASFFCNKIVLVNQYYSKFFSLFRKKTITIYNGIDFSALSFSHLQKCEDKTIQILFVGRLDIPKNPLSLLNAAKILIKKGYNDCMFTIVGNGELYDECKEYIHKNNLEEKIHLEGWKSNIGEYYQKSDIFVMSSIYEAFGLIFLEAGYYGLPTVATNVEGIPEVVKDNYTGLLCPPNNPQLIAENIMKLINNPQLRKQLGDNAKKWVEKFSSQNMVDEYIKIYNSNLRS